MTGKTETMKKPTKIITDPVQMVEICAKQPHVSAAEKRQSFLTQNGKSSSNQPLNIEKLKSQIDRALAATPDEVLVAAFSEMGCEVTPDLVNHPPHYQSPNGIESIDAIEAALTPEEFRGYCKGNALKYVWREKHKGGDQDLAKAAWYLNRLKKETSLLPT